MYMLVQKREIANIIESRVFSVPVNFDHFQILRAIGKGSFGKVSFDQYILFAFAQFC